MANPVFSSSSSFQAPARNPGYQQPYQGQPQGYEYQAQPGYQQPGFQTQGYQAPPVVGGVMTLDDVIAKTAITLLTVFATAAATFFLLPPTSPLLYPALIVSSIVGLITVFLVARRREIPVGGVLFYAAVEGVFVGALSSMFEFMFSGIVVSAVLATFVTAGATLAAYKFFNIRVTPKFRKMVYIGTMALLGVLIVNFVLALFGVNLGMRDIGSGASMLSILVSVIAVGLAVFNLIIDFDYIENGIASRAPAKESWRAAFGVTVTMVWLYVEILRILSYFRN